MPVRRYRSVSDMPAPPPADTALAGLRAACALSEASRAFGHDAAGPRGVRKFRSVADAWDHRREWEEAAMRRSPSAPRGTPATRS